MATTSPTRCASKVRHNNADEALKALRGVYGSARSPHMLVAYRCNNCSKFHLGNNRALAA